MKACKECGCWRPLDPDSRCEICAPRARVKKGAYVEPGQTLESPPGVGYHLCFSNFTLTKRFKVIVEEI